MYDNIALVCASALLITLFAEVCVNRRQTWSLPSAFVYLTVFGWYFADLFITPENYDYVPEQLLSTSYQQVCLFLVTYRLLAPWLADKFAPNTSATHKPISPVSAEVLLIASATLWVALLIWGVCRMGGDLTGTMFPLNARAGTTMWSRAAAADAGPTGFLVSTASYLYVLTSASFGILIFFIRRPAFRLFAGGLILLSWPYFLLSGTRSIFLAVSVPFFLSYFLFSWHRVGFKIAVLSVAFLAINFALLIVINFRGLGLAEYISAQEAGEVEEMELRHQGLNMIQELCFVNAFSPLSESAFGARYLGELLNVVPRVLWPDKPMLGIDYALWRGFAGGDNDTGVVATISTGLIGAGVLNFGRLFGPIAPAVLMALWTALLSRWWSQRTSLLRCMLYLAGLGVTFNLGRDFTLLVLWPVVFGYAITLLIEYLGRGAVQRKPGLSHHFPTDTPRYGAVVPGR